MYVRPGGTVEQWHVWEPDRPGSKSQLSHDKLCSFEDLAYFPGRDFFLTLGVKLIVQSIWGCYENKRCSSPVQGLGGCFLSERCCDVSSCS